MSDMGFMGPYGLTKALRTKQNRFNIATGHLQSKFFKKSLKILFKN